MKTCDTCKHWDRSDDGKQYGTELNLRICRACPAYFNATEWDDEYNRRMKPELLELAARANAKETPHE